MHLKTFQVLVSLCTALPRTAAAPARTPTSVSTVSPIHWTPCPSDLPSTVQCANYTVPLDYGNPAGATINLAVLRAKANSTIPKGNIYVNPGGPGGSGTQLVLGILEDSSLLGHQMLSEYNLVGIDPRGVGQSTPIKCDPSLWNKRVPTTVSDQAEYDALVQHWQQVGESCKKLTGPLLDHMDTVNVAKDFDRIRQAIGDDKFNYLGLSYGSQIGTTYAELFPDKVGRMVLDGILDHSQSPPSSVQTESTTFERTLSKFFEWCQRNTTCALHDQADLPTFFENLVAKAQAQPLPAPACQQTGASPCQPNVTVDDFFSSVQGGLVFVNNESPFGPGWADLAEALLAASKGNASALSAHYYTSEVDTTGDWAGLAVGCQDWARPAKSLTDLEAIMHMTNSLSPLTKGYTQGFSYISRCIGWPTKVTNPPTLLKLSIRRAPKLLLVNAFWDPECSVEWAVGVREQIPQAHLVYRNGSGHTSFFNSGEAAKAMIEFFLNGELPADGTVYQS